MSSVDVISLPSFRVSFPVAIFARRRAKTNYLSSALSTRPTLEATSDAIVFSAMLGAVLPRLSPQWCYS